ncbi:prepilin-type N-terminal cleavage/methylation domain-containing protein [Variovorax sp. CF313]|uniref:GspH/FimT family pseudopilin n=1 Tax=Variovorax sp. CF313 TaxID=1144315 RepID=UPI000270DD14|nr:GspH/FimT family pseudopilin [Variovorax sp. CF313]EJL69487.1 prepilin-type N-terminal cleavage/methylation domain-containing protein [Variovorax sp. CF313]
MKNGFCTSVQVHLRRRGTPRGFTLVEMMVVIVLTAILLALALPSFNSLIEKYRVEGMASALMASVSHARSEAVRRGQVVTIRQRAECTGADWSCGWETVVGSGTGFEIVRRQDPDARVAVEKSALGSMAFDPMGHFSSVARVDFHPVGSTGSSNDIAVCISLGWRIRLVKGGGTC